ncbi:MAG: hypothetical protein WKF75_06690 [Singulisphaera sp.]
MKRPNITVYGSRTCSGDRTTEFLDAQQIPYRPRTLMSRPSTTTTSPG